MTAGRVQTLRLGDGEVTVREAGRPASRRLCRHLISTGDERQFLEYIISVGPFKFDLPVVHQLSDAEAAAYAAGTLQLGELAERLGDEDERSGKYERAS